MSEVNDNSGDIKLFRTDAERDPLQFIELKENLLGSFSKFGYDLVKSKSLKKQLIATQKKLIIQQNKRIDYAFELSFAYEKQETYNRYTEKIREIQKNFSSLSAQTIDDLIDILDINIDRLYTRFLKVDKRYKEKYEKGEITLDQYKYEVEVRFKSVIDNAMDQTTNNINYLIDQYQEQTYLTLNNLNVSLKILFNFIQEFYKMRMIIIFYFSLLLFSCDNDVGLSVAFLRSDSIDIKQVLMSPANYSDQDIWVKGITSEIIKTPLGSMYLLTDETGSIWVKTSQLPQKGNLIFLKASVENIFLFRQYSFGLHLIERERSAIMLTKFIHFLTLTDTDELGKCSQYDHNLVYASSFRQLISFVFSFSVFLYGALMFLPFEQALLMSLLVALTLFTIDQAIIGSEWALKVNFFHKPWLNDLASVIFLPIRLIPRILFSVAIAFVIATVAEISLQHKAIDEVLMQEARVLNKDYFSRLNNKELALQKSVDAQEQALVVLDKKIKDKQTVLVNFNTDMSPRDENSIVKQLNSRSADYSAKKKQLENNKGQIQRLGVKIVEKQQLLEHWKNEKALELTTDRGAKKGVRWHHANRQMILIGLEIGALQAKVVKLTSYQPIYDEEAKNSLIKLDKLRAIKRSIGGDSLKELMFQRGIEKKELMKNKVLIKEDMAVLKHSLKEDGLFFEIKNGPLGRYIGLNKLYDDPNYGEAAKEFSYGLKLVVILIELSPVIVMVFFSPYSFYAEHMRGKKHVIESAIPTIKLKSQAEESEKQSSLLRKEKDKARANEIEEMLDKKFNQAFSDEYHPEC